jgi:exonuclease III
MRDDDWIVVLDDEPNYPIEDDDSSYGDEDDQPLPPSSSMSYAVNDDGNENEKKKSGDGWEEKPEPLSGNDAPWTGSSRSTISTVAFDPIVELGIATWNINHMNRAKPRFESKKSTLGRLFAKNQWLDVLVVQEINQISLQSFANDVKEAGLEMFLGPHMISIGPQGGKGQHEYYPIIWDATRLDFDGCWALHRGTWIPCKAGREIEWTKPAHKKKNPGIRHIRSYRPIVVYRMVTKTGGVVHICNLHTTPKGSGLSRKHEFDQVRYILEVAQQRRAQGEHWIIVGDYYLDPEASVMDRGHNIGRAGRFEHAVNQYGLELVIPLSATNQTGLSSIQSGGQNDTEEADDKESDADASKQEKKLLFGKLQKAVQEGAFKQQDPTSFIEQFLKSQPRKPKSAGASSNFLADRVVILETDGQRVRVVLNKRADFFICTRGLVRRFCGLMSPVSGVLHVDPNHNALNWWSTVSDHTPIGAIFCSVDQSIKLTNYERDFKVAYYDEIEKSKELLEKRRTRIVMDALKWLDLLLAKIYSAQSFDLDCVMALRVSALLTKILLMANVDLRCLRMMPLSDVGLEQRVSNDQLLQFCNFGVFGQQPVRWSMDNDTLVALVCEAARAAYRCQQISGYKILDFDFVDEDDTYFDRDTDENAIRTNHDENFF